MSKGKRVLYVIEGLIMLLFVFIMLIDPDDGYLLILNILSSTLMIYAVNQLLYFFTMARYMVGGRLILCKALIVLDIAVEVGYLTSIPKLYVMIYLVGGMLFAGLVDVLRAIETKRSHGIHWRLKLAHGIVTFIISALGIVFFKTANAVVVVFCITLISSAITKFTTAFRRTSIVYIG